MGGGGGANTKDEQIKKGHVQDDHGGQRLHLVDYIPELPQCCPTALQFCRQWDNKIKVNIT